MEWNDLSEKELEDVYSNDSSRQDQLQLKCVVINIIVEKEDGEYHNVRHESISKQDQLQLRPVIDIIVEKRDGEYCNERYRDRRVIDILMEKEDGEYLVRRNKEELYIQATFHGTVMQPKLCTYKVTNDDKFLIDRSFDSNIICSRSLGNDRILIMLTEYGKLCSSLYSRWMSLRSIIRRVSLRWVSLRSITRSFVVELGRVRVITRQKYRRDGFKYTCRPI